MFRLKMKRNSRDSLNNSKLKKFIFIADEKVRQKKFEMTVTLKQQQQKLLALLSFLLLEFLLR